MKNSRFITETIHTFFLFDQPPQELYKIPKKKSLQLWKKMYKFQAITHLGHTKLT